MKFEPFSVVDATTWNKVCESSSDSWFFHRHGWIEIEASLGIEFNASFALRSGAGLLGIAPLYCVINSSERLVHSGFHRHTGLALIDGLAAGEVQAARDLYMKQIFKVASDFGAHRIQLNAHNLCPANRDAKRRAELPFWVLEYGFHLGLAFGPMGVQAAPGLATCNADQIVDLAVAEDDLFARLDPACRRAVRKAQGAGLRLREPRGERDAEVYYSVALDSARRTGESLPPLDYYTRVWRKFGPAGQCRLLFAELEGVPQAALMLFADRGAITYAAGVALSEGLSLRPNDFIHWEAIRLAQREGFTHYRLGPMFPEVPDSWPIARVSRFKGKFGSRAVPIIQGSYFVDAAHYFEPGVEILRLLCARGSSAPIEGDVL